MSQSKQLKRELLRSLGELFRNLRLRLGHKQYAVADSAGISTSVLSRIERGKHMISVETLAKLIKVLAPSAGEENQVLKQVMNLAGIIKMSLGSEASITSFNQAYERAKYFMEKGDLIAMRPAVGRMEELASCPEEKATHKFSFAVWFKTHWEPNLALHYLEQALVDLKGINNEYLKHRILLALADLYCRRGLEAVAEPIVDQVIASDPRRRRGYAKGDKVQGQRVYYWAHFIKGRVKFGNGQMSEAIRLYRMALDGFISVESLDSNLAGYIEIFLAEAFGKRSASRKKALKMLDASIEKWGHGGDQNPRDPENLGWALLKKGQLTEDPDILQRARAIANLHGFGEIRDIVDAGQQEEFSNETPMIEEIPKKKLSSVGSMLLVIMLTILASQFFLIAAAAAKDLM